ncbi:MAG: general secretion pathway protein GspK [Candidatus Omnitrophica bacterium]|nr:general secretion pathway protein GspK [Candidatus Omnitrophota bacterium]
MVKTKLFSKKASILVVTLWVLVLLTLFLTGLASRLRPQLNFASKMKRRVKAHYLARGGVEKAIIELSNDQKVGSEYLGSSWANDPGIFKEVPLGDGYITLSYFFDQGQEEETTLYGVMDEKSKININKVPTSIIQSLLENIGQLDTETAINISNAIKDWKDLDQAVSLGGAENQYYKGLDEPYECKNKDFEHIEELLLVKDMTKEIFSKIKETITIYGNGKVNINTAGFSVLNGLGLDSSFAKRIIEFRKGPDGQIGTEDDILFTSTSQIIDMGNLTTAESTQFSSLSSKGVLGVSSDTFCINSLGSLKKGEKAGQRISCVVKRIQGEELEILSWEQN